MGIHGMLAVVLKVGCMGQMSVPVSCFKPLNDCRKCGAAHHPRLKPPLRAPPHYDIAQWSITSTTS